MTAIKSKMHMELNRAIAACYETQNKRQTELIEIFGKSYREIAGTQLTKGTLVHICNLHCSKDFLEKRRAEDQAWAIRLKNEGKTYKEIAEELGISNSNAYHLINSEALVTRDEAQMSEAITPEDIAYLKKNIIPGNRIRMIVKKYYMDEFGRTRYHEVSGWVKIFSCYPNIVLTDQGCMGWGEMAGYIKAVEDKA